MKKSKEIIVIALFLLVAFTLFAQNAQVRFEDNTATTRDYLNLEYPGGSYPNGTTIGVWKMVIYKSTDNIIDPLVNGLPTGDDVILTNPDQDNAPCILNVLIAPGPSGKLNLSYAVVHVSMIPTYIYGRIFNSNDPATATKYMTFTAPYYVAVELPVNIPIIPDYGWKTDPVWSLIYPTPSTHIISGSITSQWDLTGVTISATDIDPANITYDAGAYTVTVPDGWSGTITPSKTDYIFEPASYTYTDVVADIPDQNFVMKTVVVPGLPTNLAPNDITLTFTEPTAVTLTWEAPVGVNVDSYKLIWNNGPELNLGNVLTYTTDPLGAGTYTWKVCAVNNTATKTYTPVRVQINGRSTAGTNNPKADGAWAEASFIVEIVTFDFPEGTPIVPPGASVTVTITITGGSANNGTGTIPPFVNPSFVPAEQYIFDLVGAGPWTLTFNTTALWAAYYLNGIWTAVQNIGGTITIVINPTKDISGVPVVLGDVDPTLPVELSYFAATLTAENYVNIAWRTESSTDMLGYRIYRSMTENQSEAINITPVMIDAINTSNTQNYSHIDREVENGNTYYYWLEAVDYSHNSIFYETSPVYVDGPTTPELPNITTMRNAYPNPFRAGSGTTIEVAVKAGDNGTVTIYNILGQVVKTFPVNEGTNNLTWNARDSKGTLCGNGIYFYKLSTNTINQTKKMVIMK